MFDTTNAACKDTDWKVFFPETITRYSEQVAEAKAICSDCPIAMQCLAFAIEGNEFGIWGGTTMEERKRMPLRKRTLVIQQAKTK